MIVGPVIPAAGKAELVAPPPLGAPSVAMGMVGKGVGVPSATTWANALGTKRLNKNEDKNKELIIFSTIFQKD